MEAIIKERLKAVEREHNVHILLACESGSRAWGFSSPDSDYDVRFLYVHSQDYYYIRLDEQRDVIEFPVNEILERESLLKIRAGEFEYQDLVDQAESKIQVIDDLFRRSDLPEKPDAEKLDQILIAVRGKFYLN